MTLAVDSFRAQIARLLGLELDDARGIALAEVLARRLAATGLPAADYLPALDLATLDGELGALAQELTVGETYLFRHADQLRAFAEVVLPALARRMPDGGAIRILSAGCASGDEPYSLAIVARETLPELRWPTTIRAVDANHAILARARRARFRSWALRETPAEMQRRYFRPAGQEFVLADAVRRMVTFEQRNIAVDDPALWAPGSYDVVFCRNVIMYFTRDAQRATVERMARALVPGGYLFLGSAETLRGLSQRFELCHTHRTFYYRLPAEGEPARAAADDGWLRGDPAARIPEPVLPASPRGEPVASWVDAIRGAADRIAALTTAPPAEPRGAVPAAPSADRPGAALDAITDLVRRERFGDALAAIAQLPPAAAGERDIQLLQGVLLAHTGQLAAAEHACRPLLACAPVAAAAHYALALCRDAAGDPRGAGDLVHAAAGLDPTFAMPHLHLGMAARRAGDRAAACREFGHALLLLPRESAARLLMFGGGFDRDALIALCRAELAACGGAA